MEHYEKLYSEESKNKKPIQCDDKTYSAKETAKRLTPDYKQQYIEETGDKKPDINQYPDLVTLGLQLFWWYERFSLWLCNRLEKAEHSKNFYELRIKELDKYRNEVSIPEPYLTAIINILANGKYKI